MTTYPLSDTDRDIQQRARRLVDEDLIPWELHAEEHGGEIPQEEKHAHEAKARKIGLAAMNLPKDLGGGGFTTLQQVLVSEQIGRVTNALGWCLHTPAAWAPDVMTPEQIETWLKPAIRGERNECYAITEAGAGSDVDAIEATACRDGDEWVLNGVKWHVTSYNSAVHRRPRPGRQPGRRGGRRHALRARVVPLRAADGRRPLHRRRVASG
jgi:acyl-CoA dehydrogenase